MSGFYNQVHFAITCLNFVLNRVFYAQINYCLRYQHGKERLHKRLSITGDAYLQTVSIQLSGGNMKFQFVVFSLVITLGLTILSQPLAQQAAVCVDFESPVALGTQTGLTGTQFLTQNGVDVWSDQFKLSNGAYSYNSARIVAANAKFGRSQMVSINNINLQFDFSGLQASRKGISLKFADYGGGNNLSINGSRFFVGRFAQIPKQLGGVAIALQTVKFSGGYTAILTLKGVVQNMVIGGQEFFLDDVCTL
jgi:hypothetical protein